MARILFIASLHHPEALRAVQRSADAAEAPLFPPSMAQHFWEKALRRRGHTLAVFYRNLPRGRPAERGATERHSQRLSPRKVARGLINRVPIEVNPIARMRNRELLAAAAAFQPEVIWMVGDNTIITPETLAALKARHRCKLIYACGTSPIVFSHPIDRRAARLYDLVLASDYYHGIQWLELGAPRMECLPLSACDPEFHHPYLLTEAEHEAYRCEIAFVGTLVPDTLYSRRTQALQALRDFDLGIWSVHEVPEPLRPFVRGRALGEDMLKILSAAKICFNTHGDFVFYGGNLRLFEVAGAGVFQITDDLPGTRRWFPEVDGGPTIVTYSDEADLRSKVRWYLKSDAERAAIAERARQHVYRNHTYDVRAERFETLLATLE
ncbi:MAG: glycosyltransferase [Aggregatilineales bacterium]